MFHQIWNNTFSRFLNTPRWKWFSSYSLSFKYELGSWTSLLYSYFGDRNLFQGTPWKCPFLYLSTRYISLQSLWGLQFSCEIYINFLIHSHFFLLLIKEQFSPQTGGIYTLHLPCVLCMSSKPAFIGSCIIWSFFWFITESIQYYWEAIWYTLYFLTDDTTFSTRPNPWLLDCLGCKEQHKHSFRPSVTLETLTNTKSPWTASHTNSNKPEYGWICKFALQRILISFRYQFPVTKA